MEIGRICSQNFGLLLSEHRTNVKTGKTALENQENILRHEVSPDLLCYAVLTESLGMLYLPYLELLSSKLLAIPAAADSSVADPDPRVLGPTGSGSYH